MLPFQAIQEKQKNVERISRIRRSEDCAVFNGHLEFDTSVYSAGDVFTMQRLQVYEVFVAKNRGRRDKEERMHYIKTRTTVCSSLQVSVCLWDS